MEPKITIKKDYILVEPQVYEIPAIIECITKLFNVPENQEKNVIWLFKKGSLKVTYDELYKVKDFVKENLPENEKPDKKTAVVVETSSLAVMAEIFSIISENLSLNFKVFTELNTAEDWIIDK